MRALIAALLFMATATATAAKAYYKPEINSVNIAGNVTAILTTTEQIAFVVSQDIDIAIPCVGSAPIAGCDQINIGDYVKVKGFNSGFHLSCDDSAVETEVVITEIWVCTDVLHTVCTLQ